MEPMQRVINYMKDREIRPTELFRTFDKSVANKLSRHELVSRLRTSGIPLRRHEISELLDQIDRQQGDGMEVELNYK